MKGNKDIYYCPKCGKKSALPLFERHDGEEQVIICKDCMYGFRHSEISKNDVAIIIATGREMIEKRR